VVAHGLPATIGRGPTTYGTTVKPRTSSVFRQSPGNGLIQFGRPFPHQ